MTTVGYRLVFSSVFGLPSGCHVHPPTCGPVITGQCYDKFVPIERKPLRRALADGTLVGGGRGEGGLSPCVSRRNRTSLARYLSRAFSARDDHAHAEFVTRRTRRKTPLALRWTSFVLSALFARRVVILWFPSIILFITVRLHLTINVTIKVNLSTQLILVLSELSHACLTVPNSTELRLLIVRLILTSHIVFWYCR